MWGCILVDIMLGKSFVYTPMDSQNVGVYFSPAPIWRTLVTRVRVLEGQLGYFVLPDTKNSSWIIWKMRLPLIKGLMNGFSRGRHWTWSVQILSPQQQLEKKPRLTDLIVSFEQNPNDFQSPAYLQF
jgi:hypothetical protein